MSWKSASRKGKVIVFSTSSKSGRPNANVVVSLGFVGKKLLIADCMMSRSFRNIKENPDVCIVASQGKEYYRIRGGAKFYSSGKYFDLTVKRSGPSYPVKHAIMIDIKEVFNLDKMKRIF